MAEIPLFPLPLVLFPGGRLELQIFEVRYLDMVKRCMRNNSGFGIVMIEDGEQVLRRNDQQLPAVAHYGTYVTIVDFDQRPNGMLGISVEGQVKFVIRDQYEQSDRLMMAEVEFLEMEGKAPLPERHEHLASLLDTLVQHETIRSRDLEINYAEAREVGSRLAELLPCANRYKQRLLEMKDPIARLKEIGKLIEHMQESKR
ncbi:MAG: LON peptidase substrate-binding domain-containing protein [Proteobacteria bacterium]|nr:LON peptidase substrate-binding domain-containing protein [Pseudomonadota bacterium]